jgi:collagen type VI alpha
MDFGFEAYRTRGDAVNAIKRLPFMGGRTNTAEALQFMADTLYSIRMDAKPVVLLFTDGASNINAEQTIPIAIEARQRGAHIIAFGVSVFVANGHFNSVVL